MAWLAPVKEAQKANINPTGPGAYSMTYLDPIWKWEQKRGGTAFIKKCQELYHTHPWIGAAENTVSTRVASVPWHLEDGTDEEVTDKSPDAFRRPRDLLQKPLGDVRELRKELGFMPSSPSTWRGLAKITTRHMGLCGLGYWFFDELDLHARTPERIYYINPARMTEAKDKAGRLTGWVLDYDEATGTGVPLDLDEVLPIRLEDPDYGYGGIGNVERAMDKARLTTGADIHGIGVLGSGGRLSGIVAPKAGEPALTPEVYDELVKGFRAANEAPDAAKRVLILKGSVDFTPTAANPEELDLIAMAQMGRDDVLAIWGVPYSQIGGTAPAGFGGEVRSAEEAALWAGACGPRLDALKEAIQFGLLDRWTALGVTVEFEDSRPAFDDDTPKWEVASKSVNVALNNDERRALVGLPPMEDEEMGRMVWIASSLQELSTEPKVTPPALLPFTGQAPQGVPEPAPPEEQEDLPTEVKATIGQTLGIRFTPRIRKAVQKVLDEQRTEVTSRVSAQAAHLAKKPTDTHVWWNGPKWDKRLLSALEPEAIAIGAAVKEQVSKKLGRPAHKASAPKWLANLAARVRGINETTRDKIAAVIAGGIHSTTGGAELGRLVSEATAFNQERGELIARSESAHYLNASQLSQFEEFGVTRVEAIDGDDDPECAERNGTVYTLEEAAEQMELEHPQGTLDFAPVLA